LHLETQTSQITAILQSANTTQSYSRPCD